MELTTLLVLLAIVIGGGVKISIGNINIGNDSSRNKNNQNEKK